jgi:hypothetical protein
MRIRDQGLKEFGSGIRDKHPGTMGFTFELITNLPNFFLFLHLSPQAICPVYTIGSCTPLRFSAWSLRISP